MKLVGPCTGHARFSFALAELLIPPFLVAQAARHHWTMQRKFEKADVVAVAKVLKLQREEQRPFGAYAIEGTASLQWEDIWKGREQLQRQGPEESSIALIVSMRGQSAELATDERYLVFLQCLGDRLIPLQGSPVAFYRIDKEVLEPLGHIANCRREQTIVGNERIALKSAKEKLLSTSTQHN